MKQITKNDSYLSKGDKQFILFCSLFQNVPAPNKGEYYYSAFLRGNYSSLAIVIYSITGFLAGYFYRLNPWISGLCLFIVFPVTTLVEGTIYRGSHNLLPFELVTFFIYSLPSIIAVYAGKFVFIQVSKRKGKTAAKLANK